MDCTAFYRVARAVRQRAEERGYRGDIFCRPDELPPLGSAIAEWNILELRLSVAEPGLPQRFGPLVNRLCRAAVLGPADDDFAPPPTRRVKAPAGRARKW